MKKLLVFLALSCVFSFQSLHAEEDHFAGLLKDYVHAHYKKWKISEFVYVSVKKQKLYYVGDSTILFTFPVSTSRYGTGNDWNSEKTPVGLHRICSTLGEEAPLAGILDLKGFTGKIASIVTAEIATNDDLITTRALRLEGMENGKNKGGKKDTFMRDIYIHGTHEEGLIGKPASHGCIRLRNPDVIDLFNKVKVGTYVVILDK